MRTYEKRSTTPSFPKDDVPSRVSDQQKHRALSPESFQSLQRTHGNRYVQRLVASIQRNEDDSMEDFNDYRVQIAECFAGEDYTNLDNLIDQLQALKVDAVSNDYQRVIQQIDSLLAQIVGGTSRIDPTAMPGPARIALNRKISSILGTTTQQFSEISVSIMNTELTAGRPNQNYGGGEFVDPGMQGPEDALRQGLIAQMNLGDQGLQHQYQQEQDLTDDLQDRGFVNAQFRPFEMDVRMGLVKQSLDSAYQHHLLQAQGKEGQVLGVFTGPEWFFRRPDRPYTEGEFQELIARIASISADYPNMLIMPGTVLWGRFMSRSRMEIRNTSVVALNGSVVNIYHKRTDGMDLHGFEGVGELQKGMRDEYSRQSIEDSPETSGDVRNTTTNTSLFGVGNVSFAIETCRDTADARSKQEYFKSNPGGMIGGSGVQVLLLPAHGAPGSATTAPVMPGGLIVNANAAGTTSQGAELSQIEERERSFDFESRETFFKSSRGRQVLDKDNRQFGGPGGSTAMYPGTYQLPQSNYEEDTERALEAARQVNLSESLPLIDGITGIDRDNDRAGLMAILAYIEQRVVPTGKKMDRKLRLLMEEKINLVAANHGNPNFRLALFIRSRMQLVNSMVSDVPSSRAEAVEKRQWLLDKALELLTTRKIQILNIRDWEDELGGQILHHVTYLAELLEAHKDDPHADLVNLLKQIADQLLLIYKTGVKKMFTPLQPILNNFIDDAVELTVLSKQVKGLDTMIN
ncbi:MAG: hypothetical protein L0154_13570 [Chloroflexi bacterium]|nr:hypothetical protein [Chloroflexota bacterium]